jgi:hypothetical protein
MAASDSYRIAMSAKKAMESNSPAIGDWNARPIGVAERLRSVDLKDTEQPGAETEPKAWWNPQDWPPLWASFGSTLLLVVVAQTIRSYQGEQKSAADAGNGPARTPDADQPAASSLAVDSVAGTSVFEQEDKNLRERLRDLEHSNELTNAAWEAEKQAVRAARQRIRDLAKEKKLTDDEAAKLHEIVKNLNAELDFLQSPRKPPTKKAPPAKRHFHSEANPNVRKR